MSHATSATTPVTYEVDTTLHVRSLSLLCTTRYIRRTLCVQHSSVLTFLLSQRVPAPPACCVLGRPSPRQTACHSPTSSARETLFGSLNGAGGAVSDKEADGRLPGQVRDTCVQYLVCGDSMYTCAVRWAACSPSFSLRPVPETESQMIDRKVRGDRGVGADEEDGVVSDLTLISE